MDEDSSNDLARRPEPERRDSGPYVVVIDAVLSGVGTLYLVTGSMVVTAMAAGLVVLVMAIVVWGHKRDG